MNRRSDVNDRFPRFKEAWTSVEDTKKRDGFLDISPRIPEYLEGAIPVGLDESGTVVLPDSYRPEDGPPVLMLQPGEENRPYSLKGTEAEVRTAEAIALQSGSTHKVDKHILDGDTNANAHFDAHIVSSSIILPYPQRRLPLKDSRPPFELHVPRLLVVSNNKDVDDSQLGTHLAHETDHWDFYLNEAGRLQHFPNKSLSPLELRALGEKRAYDTSYRVNHTLGFLALYGDFAASIALTKPTSLEKFDRAIWTHADNLGLAPHDPIPTELAVKAITAVFGKKDVPLTKQEFEAYKKYRFIH
jgi:hypothetical protein